MVHQPSRASLRAVLFDSAGTLVQPGNAGQMRPYPGVRSTLDRLHERGLAMAVVTDSLDTAESLRFRYEQIGLSRYFGYLAVAGELGCTKPDPAIYLAASAALAVPPRETCYVDDHADMVAAAVRLGYHGLVLSRDGVIARPELRHISALDEILELVN